jgi:hypothetical protein
MIESNRKHDFDVAVNGRPNFVAFHDHAVYENKPLTWHMAWVANHVQGNKLPRGKIFNRHRAREKKADLGKLSIGSIKAALAEMYL